MSMYKIRFSFILDTDECAGDNVCPGGTCINLQGDYSCACADGYKQVDDKTCVGK